MEAALSVLLGIAIVAFASTNIDDLVVLSALFADSSIHRRAIVIGQFLGIGVLIGVSATAAVLALAMQSSWTALLGLAPIGIGLAKLGMLWRSKETDPSIAADANEHRYEARVHSQLLAVAAVTIANGGDNLGVYIPLFASDPPAVPLYVAVFIVMTALWCLLGYLLVANPLVGAVVRRWGRFILPFVLIGIGLRILWGARALLAGL